MGRKKSIATKADKGKHSLASSSSWPPQPPKKPRTSFSSTLASELLFHNQLQEDRYECFQGSKYVCGRKVDWNAIMSADFGTKLKILLKNMDWLGLADLSEMQFSPHLIN